MAEGTLVSVFGDARIRVGTERRILGRKREQRATLWNVGGKPECSVVGSPSSALMLFVRHWWG